MSVLAPTPRVARPRPARRPQGQARPRAAGRVSRAGVEAARTVIHVRDDGQVPDVELVVHLLTQPGARRHGCSSASAVQRRRQASKRREHALFDSELLGRRRRQGRDRSGAVSAQVRRAVPTRRVTQRGATRSTGLGCACPERQAATLGAGAAAAHTPSPFLLLRFRWASRLCVCSAHGAKRRLCCKNPPARGALWNAVLRRPRERQCRRGDGYG